MLAKLPRQLSQFIGKLIGHFNFRLKTRSYLVTRANLELCFPDLDISEREELTYQSLLSTGQTLMETPAVWLAKPQKLKPWIKNVVNEGLLDEVQREGKGLVVLLPHIGNW